MNKFKRDLDEFVGESPRFKESLKRKILSDMKKEERPMNRFAALKNVAVMMLLLIVATTFLVLNLNGNDTDPAVPASTPEELPALTDPDTVAEIESFTEMTEPQEVFDFRYDAMDRGNYEYYEHPLLIDPAAYQDKEPARGDVVIHEAEFFDGLSRTVGRIIALPGETVEVVDGQIYINDRKLDTFYGRAHRRGYSLIEEYNEAMIEMNQPQNVDAMKEILSQSTEAFTLGEDEVYVMGDDWFRSHELIIKVDEIQAEVLGYYVE
ncbi:S26 family signal peptidase [Planomicrobium okeanokoites]|uniref:S26 family signal peptidase n=1 Tax=Planomicrobium okeanokoites TaxID=244 RepID=UPI000A07302D|nr:S26 family signal peptidase [Planomicrobium okeanokoites]